MMRRPSSNIIEYLEVQLDDFEPLGVEGWGTCSKCSSSLLSSLSLNFTCPWMFIYVIVIKR